MGICCNSWYRFWQKHDPDDVFAYSTVKIVKIRDRQLGLLHYAFQLGILIYIVVYVMILSQAYLAYDEPIGVIRANIQQCPNGAQCEVDMRDLPYCNQNATALTSLECRFTDQSYAQYPPGQGDPLFVGTRINQTTEVLSSSCPPTGPVCSGPAWIAYDSPETDAFFIAGVENWSIQLDHSVTTPHFARVGSESTKYQGNGVDLQGELIFEDGRESMQFPVSKPVRFTLATIMEAANTYIDSPSDTGPAYSTRYDGAVVLVSIEYTNTYTVFAPASSLRYTIKAKRIKETEYKSVFPVTSNSTHRTNWNMHGIYLEFVQTGKIGKFDFQVMLVQLVAALALLSVATVIVDSVAIYFKDLRQLYYEAKFEETRDFSDVRDELRAREHDEEGLNGEGMGSAMLANSRDEPLLPRSHVTQPAHKP